MVKLIRPMGMRFYRINRVLATIVISCILGCIPTNSSTPTNFRTFDVESIYREAKRQAALRHVDERLPLFTDLESAFDKKMRPYAPCTLKYFIYKPKTHTFDTVRYSDRRLRYILLVFDSEIARLKKDTGVMSENRMKNRKKC